MSDLLHGARQFWIEDDGSWNLTAYTSERKAKQTCQNLDSIVHVLEAAPLLAKVAELEQLTQDEAIGQLQKLAIRAKRAENALNCIYILSSGDSAYTSEFTERVRSIVVEALRK